MKKERKNKENREEEERLLEESRERKTFNEIVEERKKRKEKKIKIIARENEMKGNEIKLKERKRNFFLSLARSIISAQLQINYFLYFHRFSSFLL